MLLEFTNKLIIRKASIADIPKIVSIHKDCVLKINSKFYTVDVIKEWADTISFENVLGQFNNTEWIVCELDKEIVGFAQYSTKDKTLFQIQVSPKFQRKGIGNKFYRYIEKEFIKSSQKVIFLNSTLKAVVFYKGLGFRKVGGIKFVLSEQFIKMIKMEKVIG
ncbi:GNAT family N-acetyltransferase [Patescibacteria group bacterium]|nr:GNAT family N-acetyltransferase [Patescibacteria group bacterium]